MGIPFIGEWTSIKRAHHPPFHHFTSEALYTSKKDKLYDGNNAINQRVTSIMASIDDIPGLPSYNLADAIIQFIFCRAWPGKHATIQ
jgi:hypothetical protein